MALCQRRPWSGSPWDSGIPGIVGIMGRNVAVSLNLTVEFRNSLVMGIMVRDFTMSLPLWYSRIMEIMGVNVIYHWVLLNSGIPGNMGIIGRDAISLGPLEFGNYSRNYGNYGKRCHITGLSGIIVEFPELWE